MSSCGDDMKNQIIEDKITKVPNLYYTIVVRNFNTIEKDVANLVATHKEAVEFNCILYIRLLRLDGEECDREAEEDRPIEDPRVEYEKKLEEHGYRRIGAVAMNARLGKRADRDTKNFNKGQFLGVPYPGTDEAVARGCTCPQHDNWFGRGIDGGGNLFWINQSCPIHGAATGVAGKKMT